MGPNTRAVTNVPKVVISDKPPPQVALRDEREERAVGELLTIMRRGGEPIVIVYRQAETGEIEVSARSSAFSSVVAAMELMRDAAAKLSASLLRRRFPARDTITS